ncbi:hypothetical protein EPI10_012427 [Gossypium australe]|uniref:Uncharacterized protein n=1 Tax=Gossypium australe TaxID=47621 RepID=A0A5B6WBK8_9ROSI|nr:hypothetical protein EPI10_012427 [Gossypium australe]
MDNQRVNGFERKLSLIVGGLWKLMGKRKEETLEWRLRIKEIKESEKENGGEMEDLPIDLVDGKKRQRVNSKEGKSGEIRGMVELQTEISAANVKLADRRQ